MAEDTKDTTQTQSQSDDSKANADKATADQGQATQDIDVTKLSDDQLKKVLEHPNFFNLDRVKRMREAETQLKEIKESQSKAEDENLQKSKKFEELAAKREKRIQEMEAQIKESNIRQALVNRLVKENPLNLESALKLVDYSKISVDDQGTVQNVESVIEVLKKDNPFLFQKGSQQMGTATNSNEDQGTSKIWTRESIKKLSDEDYKKYSKEIHAAAEKGLIKE